MPEVHRIDSIESAPVVGDHSLQKLVHMMLLDKLNTVDEQVRVEVDVLLDRQKRVEFMNKYLRETNGAIDRNGTIQREKLNDLFEEGLEMKEEADNRLASAEALQERIDELAADDQDHAAEIAQLEKERDWLNQSAEEINTMLQACDIIDKEGNAVKGPVTYSDTAASRLQENIRSYSKILQTRNNTQSQMVQRLNNERNEALMLAKDIQRTIHEIMKRIASNISR